jgi:DNA-binding MarR family transcriptional regulator
LKTVAPKRIHVVREPRQVAAMASPVRLRILAGAGAQPPLSVAELSAQVGMAPASLYYHVRKLVAAGLLGERGRRRAGKRWEITYGPAAGAIVADPNERSAAFLRALGRVYRAVLRDAARGLARALDEERREGPGPRRATAVRHRRVRLSPQGETALRERLEHLDAFLQAADDPTGRAHDVTIAMSRCVLRGHKGRPASSR